MFSVRSDRGEPIHYVRTMESRVKLKAHASRRARLLDAVAHASPRAIVVIPAAPVGLRNNDVEHEYRQDSDFFYLTGFDEPGSVLVLSVPDRKCTFFVRPRDPTRETWDGPRAGVDGAVNLYGAHEAFPIADFGAHLPSLLGNKDRLYYRLGRDRSFDDQVLEAVEATRARQRAGITWPREIVDPGVIVHEMRLIKEASEIDSMVKAAAITRDAHVRAMSEARAGLYEYTIDAVMLEVFRRHGSDRVAYGSIVGSGPNATILHYRAGHRQMQDGELLLIDAGCEFDYYASDVTRTFPVNGRFSSEQRAIYELVLEAQTVSIAATKVGATLPDIHFESVKVLSQGLLKLGLLSGSLEAVLESESYKRFYMHRTGHWLGMDVHDVGAYTVDGTPRPLAAGMVTTVEPGLYIGVDDTTVNERWRGIGVRIEDDILVTDQGPRNLTVDIPKTVEEVEQACRS